MVPKMETLITKAENCFAQRGCFWLYAKFHKTKEGAGGVGAGRKEKQGIRLAINNELCRLAIPIWFEILCLYIIVPFTFLYFPFPHKLLFTCGKFAWIFTFNLPYIYNEASAQARSFYLVERVPWKESTNKVNILYILLVYKRV